MRRRLPCSSGPSRVRRSCSSGASRVRLQRGEANGPRIPPTRLAPLLQALRVCCVGAIAVLAGCAGQNGIIDPRGYNREGVASYYGARHHGARTASGERFDQQGLTAAHRQLPFGTRVVVTNLSNKRNVVVRINDRGPHSRGRLIDVSKGAAEELGMLRSGTARVRVQTLQD